MVKRKYTLKKNILYVRLDNNIFYIFLNKHTYYAKYDFNIEDMPDHHIDMMVYYIMYGFGENKTAKMKCFTADFYSNTTLSGETYVDVDIPPFEKEHQVIDDLSFFNDSLYESNGDKKLIMFSGGYDSVSLKVLIPEAHCVYLYRDYDKQYGKNQEKVVKQANSHVVINNIEKIRIQYTGKHGFNTGNGYASLMIPYLSKYGADEILCGPVFDDVAFGYPKDQDLSFGKHHFTSRGLNSIYWTKRAGINVSYPNAGLSETWTTKLVDNSVYKDSVSSCHVKTNTNFCGECYKCLRKLPMRDMCMHVKPKAIISGETHIKTKPLKMACSTTYGIQKLKSDNKYFKLLDSIDVSFLDRYSRWHTSIFTTPKTLALIEDRYLKFGIKEMTDDDYINIEKFRIDIDSITNNF
tara:strand:+ start:747 stop:1970 length:1224 start_codon:yes stop_codon:yes gene_type:complete